MLSFLITEHETIAFRVFLVPHHNQFYNKENLFNPSPGLAYIQFASLWFSLTLSMYGVLS